MLRKRKLTLDKNGGNTRTKRLAIPYKKHYICK